MTKITLVTGNKSKLYEYEALIPQDTGILLIAAPLDLVEIQSLDPHEIVTHKLKEAYRQLGQPVIVEDVSAGLESLNGLPGPFIKFFEERLGKGALFQLSKKDSDRVTIVCTSGYYDGKKMLFGEGIVRGTIVASRGTNGFGFDSVVVPDGETRTSAEMTYEEKNAISHRSLAIKDLLQQLE